MLDKKTKNKKFKEEGSSNFCRDASTIPYNRSLRSIFEQKTMIFCENKLPFSIHQYLL